MTKQYYGLGPWKASNTGFLSRPVAPVFLLFFIVLGGSCTAGRVRVQTRPEVGFGFDFDSLRCTARGVSVRCEPESRMWSDVSMEWFDRRRGWRSGKFEGGTVPRDLVCGEEIDWLLFHSEGSEVVWLSTERDVRKWKGCSQPEPYQNFYFPLAAAPGNPWIRYGAATGAEFVAVRFVPYYPDDPRPVSNLPVVLLSNNGKEELLGTTDATGWIVLSKEMLKKKDGRYLLVNPTYDFDRVAVPLQQVLQEAGSYFRDVFLVSVGFY